MIDTLGLFRYENMMSRVIRIELFPVHQIYRI